MTNTPTSDFETAYASAKAILDRMKEDGADIEHLQSHIAGAQATLMLQALPMLGTRNLDELKRIDRRQIDLIASIGELDIDAGGAAAAAFNFHMLDDPDSDAAIEAMIEHSRYQVLGNVPEIITDLETGLADMRKLVLGEE